MSTAHSSMEGYQPSIAIGAGNPEALKYGKLYEMPEYRAKSPGEHHAQTFLAHARPAPGTTVVDFGTGTGRGALMLAILGGCKVIMVDFVRNSLDPEIQQALTTQADVLSFVKADLEQPLPPGVAAEYGFCCDVMEHIPPDKVDRVLDHILLATRHVFFSIATTPDRAGPALLGEPLHLTVQPASWWLERFRERDCVIHWSQEQEEACFFYVTAWMSGEAITEAGLLNTADALILDNVRHNIAQGWTQAVPHWPTADEAMLVGGGPSLSGQLAAIKVQRRADVKLITLNGAYTWALAHDLTPSATVVVDARQFNARFTHPVVDGCKYLISSQCHPDVFEGLPKDRTLIWQPSSDLIEDTLKAQYGEGGWYPIPGGSTVLLRAIPLMRMLGVRRFHLYGCDSCLADGDAHHAYAQPENDGTHVANCTLGGRVFRCHPWMISQAQELISLIRVMGDEFELQIHGGGLLAYILEHAAEMEEADAALKEATGQWS